MKKAVLSYKTIILSDIHLGTLDCKIDQVNHFIRHTKCEKLILNGDIIDGWSLKRKGGWTRKHTRFVRLVLRKLEKRNTEVIYLRGNHDDFLKDFLPFIFDRLEIVEEYIHEGEDRRYLVIHGDAFDAVTQNSKFIAIAGDIGYQQLLRINRLYNKWRAWRGKEFFSLSKAIKAKVKQAVNYISNFENLVQDFARKRGCDGFICGHIHTPDDKMIGGIHYLNSGDWVESMTAIVEHHDGRMEVLLYSDFCEQLQAHAQTKAMEKGRPYDDGLSPLAPEIVENEEDDEDSEVLIPLPALKRA